MPNDKILLLAGPTAVGKSSLAYDLARSLDGEIVSVDSVQVYKGMDIGTAKATVSERSTIPHHMIDLCHPNQSFSVIDFYNLATAAIANILSRGKTPILVGGTGLYFRAFIYYPPNSPSPSPSLRSVLSSRCQTEGIESLYKELCQLDPRYALSITRRDKQKITRALEIIHLSGKRVSDFQRQQSLPRSDYDLRCWFLDLPKDLLNSQIKKRCQRMISLGLIDEVSVLKDQGLNATTPAGKAIGYRQGLAWLASEQTTKEWNQFQREFTVASQRYAKRQTVWFRREPIFRPLNILDNAREVILSDWDRRLADNHRENRFSELGKINR